MPATHDTVILITGAGSGIGAALARRLAATPGTALVLHGRAADDAGRGRLEAVAQVCSTRGATVLNAHGDLSQPGVGVELVGKALRAYGRVDQIVHNAGFADSRQFGELRRSDLDRSLSAMPGAFLDIVDAALPTLSTSRKGRVVAVSSFVAHRFVPGQVFPASAAAKAALEALAKSLAVQLAPTGATVNVVVPGFTRKDEGKLGSLSSAGWKEAATHNPQRRLAWPEDIAAAIAFLLSDEAAHMTGAVVHVDGGLTLG